MTTISLNNADETSPWLDLSVKDQLATNPTYTFYEPYKMGLSTLENLGNTCFLNTVIQCLCHTPAMAKYVLKGQYSTRNRLWRRFAELIKTMTHDNYRLSPNNFFREFVLAFKKNNNDQEDFHEVLSFILNHFHEALQFKIQFKDQNDGQLINASIKELNTGTKMSIITDLFLGQLHQRIQCSKCKNVSNTFPTFLDIVLRLDKTTDYRNIYNLLHAYCDKETLEDDEAYNCDHCGEKKVKAYKKTTFWRLPQYLIIVLGRFDWQGNKNSKFIDYPITGLDLSKHITYPDKSTYIYDLYSVACHIGTTRGGHYYTIALVNGQWTLFNDERFKSIHKLEEVVTPDAYVFFYKRNIPM